MKKTVKLKQLFIGFLLAFIFMLGVFMPCMPSLVFAEEGEKVKYSLLPSTYNQNTAETFEKYNISQEQTSGFTPFDFEQGKRMDGMSFVFETAENNQIINQYVLLDEIASITQDGDYALGMWIYFDNIYLHNFEVSLIFNNGSSLSWYLTSTDLYALVSESGSLAVDSLPYGYVRVELPFELAIIDGEIYSAGLMISPEKMVVNYVSEISDFDNFASLRFYDVYLTETADKTAILVEKQGYRFWSVDFFAEELIDNFCVGDSITLKTKNNAINYAWDGASDLVSLSNGENPNIVWKVLLKTPSSESNLEYKSFGETVNLNIEGTYQIYYQCYDLRVSNDKYIISESISINVAKLNAVVFENSIRTLEVGKTYIFNISTSVILKNVSEYVFLSSSEFLTYEYLGGGTIEITATRDGDYTLTVAVNASREVDKAVKEYSSTISFKAVDTTTEDDTFTKIILWSILGAFGVAFIVFIIKTLVKARKYDVK